MAMVFTTLFVHSSLTCGIHTHTHTHTHTHMWHMCACGIYVHESEGHGDGHAVGERLPQVNLAL